MGVRREFRRESGWEVQGDNILRFHGEVVVGFE